MLKTIVTQSVKLTGFLLALELALYQPQLQHLTRLVEALVVCDSRKTLSALYRAWVDDPDPKTAADFLRESPWDPEALNRDRRHWMLEQLLLQARALELGRTVFVSVDDSLGQKDKATRHLDAVAFHHNHTESTRRKPKYSNGFVFVETHLQIGPLGFTFDTRLYVREATVRRLNRQRTGDQPRVAYRSKYRLARAMLNDLADILPDGYPVYVLFDAWYASAKLINFCRRHGWHVICALKANRHLHGKRLDDHDRALWHTRYTRVRGGAVDDTDPPSYYVRAVRGRLNKVKGDVCVLISRRHPGDPRPKYFLCTDLALASAQDILRNYEQRWPVEVDNFYLKEPLGLGDFRVQSLEATAKWFAVVVLTLNFLQHEQMLAYRHSRQRVSLAELIRQHRAGHAQAVLRAVAQDVLRTGEIEPVLQRFIRRPAVAVT